VAKTIHSKSYRALIKQIRELRTAAGVSQVELAARLGRSQTWVSKIELGELRLDIEDLRQICVALNHDLVTLVRKWLAAIK
jgi:transcriptional regulator with XRE-family HTH domain